MGDLERLDSRMNNMNKCFFNKFSFVLIAVIVSLSSDNLARGSEGQAIQWMVIDHPDAQEAPPSYGLRLDNLFQVHGLAGATGGATTFSLDGVILDLLVNDSGELISLNFSGQVTGGEDDDNGYGFGFGQYDFDLTYQFNLTGNVSSGVETIPTEMNQGSLVAGSGIDGVQEGTEFLFYEKVVGGMPFALKPDGFRIDGDESTWVGAGWLTYDSEGGPAEGTLDIIFAIPEPHTLLFGLLGFGALMLRRS